jgi:hypothetical protein
MNNPEPIDSVRDTDLLGWSPVQWPVTVDIPRPQGNLPMFSYGLKKPKQNSLMNQYNSVLKGPSGSERDQNGE